MPPESDEKDDDDDGISPLLTPGVRMTFFPGCRINVILSSETRYNAPSPLFRASSVEELEEGEEGIVELEYK